LAAPTFAALINNPKKKVKNLSLIMNAVLAVAVAVLFYLHFSKPSDDAPKSTVDMAAVDSVSSRLRIAYIDIDTVLANYGFILEKNEEMKKKQTDAGKKVEGRARTLEAQFGSMMQELQTKAQQFEKDAEGMSELVRNTKMKELQDMEMNLRQFQAKADEEVSDLEENLSNALVEENLEYTKHVRDEIDAYLKEYNADGRFTYVLSSGTGMNILQADPALNITQDVLNGLNARYEAKKAAEADKK
jgi:outer membrane protein